MYFPNIKPPSATPSRRPRPAFRTRADLRLRHPWRTLAATMLALALNASAADPWKPGSPLVALGSYGLEGPLPDLKGKVVLVDFWASWCAPCKLSFPVLEALHRKYAAQGLVVIGISVDEEAPPMKRFLESHAASFTIVRDATRKLVEAAGIEAMPTSFLIDRRGVIRAVHKGFHAKKTEAELIVDIERLLAQKEDGP